MTGRFVIVKIRAESGTRTRDLLITNELLYQLSYFGKQKFLFCGSKLLLIFLLTNVFPFFL